MKTSILTGGCLLVLLTACEDTTGSRARCEVPVQTITTSIPLEDVPNDSVISAIVRWESSIPEGAVDQVRLNVLEIIHVFRYQPAVLFEASGEQVRNVAGLFPDAIVHLGAPGTTATCRAR